MSPRCPCEPNPFIAELTIPSGLSRLPRQRGRFGDYRRSLLASSRTAAGGVLAEWNADDASDLGLLLIDSWAYLLDIVSFYDGEIAQESYLSTATRTRSASELTNLIGYTLQPATAASVTLALRAVGRDPVRVPAGTAFRSAGWDTEKPQVFEVTEDTWIYPALNELTLEPVRSQTYDGNLWLAPDGNAPAPGQVIALRKAAVSQAAAARVVEVVQQRTKDGVRHRRLVLEAVPSLLTGAALDSITVYGFAQSASPSAFPLVADSGAGADERRYIVLDALYPQLRKNDDVLIELTSGDGTTVHARRIEAVKTVYVNAGTHPSAEVRVPCTEIEFSTLSAIAGNVARVHVRPHRLADLTNPSLNRLNGAELAAFVPLAQPLEPFDSEQPAPPNALYKGARDAAYVSPVSFDIDPSTGRAQIKADEPSRFAGPLRAPISVHGNLVGATRGETVHDEVLGSADGSKPFQTFTLKKKPLTFLPSAAPSAAAMPALEVRVNGVRWSRVDSFVDATEQDEVYVLRVAPDGSATIEFGDKAIPPTGTRNVTASYRYGAGAAKPPAGLINKLASPVPGIDGVVWSLPPTGGRDADQAMAIRENAPASLLAFGRAVSLYDYEALAQQYPGVRRASAGWAYASATQRAQVVIWVLSDGGSVAAELASYLTGVGDPDLPVLVQEAVAIETSIEAEVRADERYVAADVRSRIVEALTDPASGLLSPTHRPMRQSLFRSQLIRAIVEVHGVHEVTSLSINGSTTLVGLTVPEGHYRLYTPVEISVTT